MDLKLHKTLYKVLRRIINKIKDYYRYKKAIKMGTSISDENFLATLKLNGIRSLDLKDDYNYKGKFIKQIINKNKFNKIVNIEDLEFIRNHFSGKRKLVDFANEICNHNFDLLGSGKVHVSYNLEPRGLENNVYKMNLKDTELNEIKEKIQRKILLLFSSSENSENTNNLDFTNCLIDYAYDPIDWHIDFKSGYRWDNKTWYKLIKHGHLPGVDIKVPWELSRCYHFLTLGQAYWLTGDEKYTQEYIYQTVDWIENNPSQFGVNWLCTMDIAIRVCNWITSLFYFRHSKLLNEKFYFEICKNIFSHGTHIRNNLEKAFFEPKTNHYLSDIAGLLYLGLFFYDSSPGKVWFDFAIKELRNQMHGQVYKDGCDFEASTYYHRLVLELFFYPTIISIRAFSDEFSGSKLNNYLESGGKLFGLAFIEKLHKMFEAILYLLNPLGIMPQVGDNDNGRLHIYCIEETSDMNYLLSLAAIFFNESKFKVKEFKFSEDSLWIFGKHGLDYEQNSEESSLQSINSRAFLNSGWYIMRDNKSYMIISCGSNGQSNYGGHSHNDKLSFELFLNGKSILVDPGTYLYTPLPEFRNKFRSTYYHNTITVDNKEQSRFINKSIFLLKNDARVKLNSWISNEKYDFFDAEHYGYQRLENKVLHQRQVFFDKENLSFFIKDIMKGEGRHFFNITFNLNNEVSLYLQSNTLIAQLEYKLGKYINIHPLKPAGLNAKIENSFISPGYGEIKKTNKVIYFMEADVPCEFLFVLSSDEFNYSEDYINKKLEEIVDYE